MLKLKRFKKVKRYTFKLLKDRKYDKKDDVIKINFKLNNNFQIINFNSSLNALLYNKLDSADRFAIDERLPVIMNFLKESNVFTFP